MNNQIRADFRRGDPDDAIYLDSQKRARESLIRKWEWYLDGKEYGLKPIDENLWETMAMIFENQQQFSARGPLEQTMTTDLVLPATYSLPIIRKIFPELFLLKIASVQPLPPESGGVGRIFYQDFQREDASDVSVTVADSDYAYNVENGVPKRLKMVITSDTLTATKDILGASWSTEVMEDARGTLGIDVEAELIDQMANEIKRELEERSLTQMVNEAGAGNVNWTHAVPAGTLPKDHYETLVHAFIDAEDLIFGNRYRKADYIVAGRQMTTWLMKSSDFKVEPRMREDNSPSKVGVQFIGTLNGLWDVYTSLYMTTTKALMGMYPGSQTDAGYIFAPYIPLAAMPLVYAEFMPYNDATMPGAYVNTDKWSRNVRTRNGKKMVVPEMFATITITD